MSYFTELREKPKAHRERFALLSAATITLFIFGFWAMTKFSGSEVVADATSEVTPIASFTASVGESFKLVKQTFMELISTSNTYVR